MPYITFYALNRLVNERGWQWWRFPGWNRPVLRNTHGRFFDMVLGRADPKGRTLILDAVSPPRSTVPDP